MPLPPFALDAIFSPDTARHDKVTLRVEPYFSISGSTQSIDDFRDFLAVPPPALAESEDLDSWGTVFNRPRKQRSNIRSSLHGSSTDAPLPLFGGYCLFSPYSNTTTGTRAVSLATLELWANPTRLVRYQGTAYIPPRRNFAQSGANMVNEPSPDCDGEFSLDDSDNWTPDTPTLENLNRPPFWIRHLKVSIEESLRIIESEVNRAGRTVHRENFDRHVNVTHMPNQSDPRATPFNLREVETYWEFQSDAPFQRVKDIESLLCSFGELDAVTRMYEHASLGNGISVTVPVKAGVKIKVYAKTSRRIRCEVVHDLQECNLPPHIRGTDPERHTFSMLNGVYLKTNQLRQDAADIMNAAFRHMRNQRNIPATSKTALNFIYDLSQEIADPEIARTLLWILVTKGCVVSRPPFSPYLQALKHRGILETQAQNRKRAYVVTPRYRFALDALAANCNFPHLTARHRSRAPRPVEE